MTQRVLFTASTASHIRNFHLPYLRRFRELGWAVDVACAAPAGDIPEADRVIPLPFRKKITAPANFRATALLRRELRRTDYDLIVTHTALAAFFTRLALPRSGPRPAVVNMVHGYLFDLQNPGLRDKLLLQAEKLTAGRTDLVLTMNETDLETAQALSLAPRVAFVPGVGVDFRRLDAALAQDRAALRRELGLGPEEFVLLYAAEFSRRKNQPLLLRALAKLPERVTLALAGSGAELEGCKALAKELGVGRRVRFLGQVAEMAPWFAAADAAVSSSKSEGLPFNIMEAMYAALPVVASDCKGHTDLLTQDETGLLYPAGDADACAQAVERLLKGPELGSRLGGAAHRAALNYSLERVLPQVMDAYLSAVQVPALV